MSAPQGTTGYKILELASQNSPSFTFHSKEEPPYGHFIESINGIKEDTAAKLSWFIYKNGEESKVGIDKIIPKNGDTITFKYRKYEGD